MALGTETALDERPRRGDVVKLCGNHRYAGYRAKYIDDRANYNGGKLYPWVRLLEGDRVGDEVVVVDPELQMKRALKEK